MTPNNKHQKSGLKCPQCEFFIEFSIPQLLSHDEFFCPGCGLVLSLDHPTTKDSTDTMNHLHGAFSNLEAVRNKYSENNKL